MKRLNKSVNLNKAKLSIFYKFYFKGIFTVGKLWSILDADFKALLMSFSLTLLFLVRSFLPVLLEINAHEPVSKNIIFLLKIAFSGTVITFTNGLLSRRQFTVDLTPSY